MARLIVLTLMMALGIGVVWPTPVRADVAAGKILFGDRGCSGCHTINGEGGAVGPDLTDEGSMPGRDRDWHVRHLMSPADVVPGSIMPVLVENETEAGDLADFLLSLKGDTSAPADGPSADVAEPAPVASPKTTPAVQPKAQPAAKGAVESTAPKAKLVVSADDVTGVSDTGEALYNARGCPLCHKVGGEGGDVGPDLSGAGNNPKRDMGWYMAYVMDPKSLLPASRMPAVIQDRDEAAHIAAYLMSLKTGAAPTPWRPDPAAGQQVFAKRGCKACHSIRGTGGGLGPDLTFEGEVAGHDADWHRRHLANPKSTSPGSVMPRFNLPEQERENLIAYLRSLVRLEKDKTLVPLLAARFAALGTALEDLKNRVESARLHGRNVDDFQATLGQAWTHVGAVEEMIRRKNLLKADDEIAQGEALASELENAVTAFELEFQERKYWGGLVLVLLLFGAYVLTKKVNLLSMEWEAGEAARQAEKTKKAANKPRRALPATEDDGTPSAGGDEPGGDASESEDKP